MKSAKIEMQDDGERGRDTWMFPLAASVLKDSCEAWAKHHRDHETYWQMQVGRLEPLRKASAVVTEQPVTGGVQQVLHYDPGLDREYGNAINKRDLHRTKAQGFEQWATCFGIRNPHSAQNERIFDLTPADVEAFHIGEEPPDDLPAYGEKER